MGNTYYTGVGSRKTPEDIFTLMTKIAYCLRICQKYILRSGGAAGADTAFELGAENMKEIYTHKDATSEAMALAAKFHPAWDKCSDFARKLHGRNAFQVLGRNLTTPSSFLICWTPDGCTSHSNRQYKTGGTGTAISIADANNIPIYNLKNKETLDSWNEYVIACKEWLKGGVT